jgi:hypothetical protein
VGLVDSATDVADGAAVSDRWAQAQPLTISATAKTRNAVLRDKRKPDNQAATYYKFIEEMQSLLARLVPLQLDSPENAV